MPLMNLLSISLLRIMNILIYRKNHLIGYEDTRLVANHCFGQDKFNAGANLILTLRKEMDMLRLGQFVMMTLLHGIVMLKNLRVSAEIKMAWKIYQTESFFRHGK